MRLRSLRLPWAALAIAATVLPAACTTPDVVALPGDAGADVLEEAESFDAGVDAGTDADAGAPTAYVRIAHASPDTEALDLCVTPHAGGKAEGPLLADFAEDASVDGGGRGVAFGQVTRYVALPPGAYDVTWLAAGAKACAPTPGDAEAGVGLGRLTTPALASGDHATILVAGDRTPAGKDAALTARVLLDDAALAGGGAALRAVNAWPSVPSLDLGMGPVTSWVPLFVDVPFGGAGARTGPGEGSADSNDFVPIDPSSVTTLTARTASADAAGATATATGVTIDQGSIVTVFAVGAKTGDHGQPPALLVCVDNARAGGLLTPCVGP